MTDFKISNLSIRIEDQALPKGVIQGHGRAIGHLSALDGDSSGGPPETLPPDVGAGCGCTCSCTCTCTCTTSGAGLAALPEFEDIELTMLRESLRSALNEVEGIQATLQAERNDTKEG
jgi:hypothetical protein